MGALDLSLELEVMLVRWRKIEFPWVFLICSTMTQLVSAPKPAERRQAPTDWRLRMSAAL